VEALPTMAEIDILMDVRFIEIDQGMLLIASAIQCSTDLLDEAFALLWIRASEQFLGLFPRQIQPPQGGADGFTAIAACEPIAHQGNQTSECPTRLRIGLG
jgi:hypothetical protein